MWLVFALLSALFAALTSILAKIGIEGVNSNLATAIPYIGGIGSCLGNSIRYRCPKRTWRDKQKELDVSHPFGLGYRLFMAMLLQGIAGG